MNEMQLHALFVMLDASCSSTWAAVFAVAELNDA